MSTVIFRALLHMGRGVGQLQSRAIRYLAILGMLSMLFTSHSASAEQVVLGYQAGSSKIQVVRVPDPSEASGAPVEPASSIINTDFWAYGNVLTTNVVAAISYDTTNCTANSGINFQVTAQPEFGTLYADTVVLPIPDGQPCAGTPMTWQSADYEWTKDNSNPASCALSDTFQLIFGQVDATVEPAPIIIPFPIVIFNFITFNNTADFAPRIMYQDPDVEFIATSGRISDQVSAGALIDITCDSSFGPGGSGKPISRWPSGHPWAALDGSENNPNVPTVAVGQNIPLSLRTIAPPGTWLDAAPFPSIVGGYSPGPTSCSSDADDPAQGCPATADLTDPSSDIYFTNAGPTGQQTSTVRRSSGSTGTSSTDIYVVGPSPLVQTIKLDPSGPGGQPIQMVGTYLQFGSYNKKYNPTGIGGIAFTEPDMKSPPSYVGAFQYVQTVESFTATFYDDAGNTQVCTINRTPGLDLSYPYPAVNNRATDSPGWPTVSGSPWTSLVVIFKATMYVQWIPGAIVQHGQPTVFLNDSIPATLGATEWEWIGVAAQKDRTWSVDAEKSSHTSPVFVASPAYPQWTQVTDPGVFTCVP